MNWSSHYDFLVLHMLGKEKSIREESFIGPIKRYPYFQFHSSIKSHLKLSFLNNFVHFSCIFWLFMKEQLVIMIVWVRWRMPEPFRVPKKLFEHFEIARHTLWLFLTFKMTILRNILGCFRPKLPILTMPNNIFGTLKD